MHHYRKTMAKYLERKQAKACPFCDPKTLDRAVYENEYLYIVPNLTQYDLWELHDVEDHLLVIPKRHVHSLAGLNKDERLAVMDEAARFEELGYNVYARAVGSATRSVDHQHTHLVKISTKHPRLAIYMHKPYFLFKR